MGLFRKSGDTEALKRVISLEDSFEKLKRDMRAVEAEWLDTLERNKRIMGRIFKRAAYIEDKESEAESSAASSAIPPNSHDNGGLPLPGLTPKQRLINSQILSRRRPPE
jgi:hypothetical protein